jgi:S1-C subfamily serine protease
MQMKPTVESLIQANYPIQQVDVSRETELARQFNVTGVPCFVMLVKGREVHRVVGAQSSERLQQLFSFAKNELARQVAEERSKELRGQSKDDRTPPPSVDTALPQELHSKLLSSSVRLTVEDAKGRSHGTGTIIDARKGEALLITCGHLFRETKGEAPVKVELFESGPQGVRVVESVTGTVISYDLHRDVAFVSIRPTHTVCVAPVAPPRTPIAKGDLAASVGCNNGQDPTVLPTRITWLDRYQGPPNIEAAGAPVEGRSGGALFNDKGQLVGVCFAADYEGNRGLYAGLQSIHDELSRLGLEDVYANPKTSELAENSNHGQGPMTSDPEWRGQEMPAMASIAQADATPEDSGGNTSQPSNATTNHQLNAVEQATLEEVVSRAATKKVTCIIQSNEPGVENEIITIENVSNEFVEALAARRRKEATGATTGVAEASRDDSHYNR